MKKSIIRNALGLIMMSSFSWVPGVVAQTTNFTSVQMQLENGQNGVFVRFSADVGRIYQLKSSTDLTNWAIIQQIIGSDTNMSFYVPLTNRLSGGPGGGTNFPSPPGFNGANINGDGTDITWPPMPPSPWDPDQQQRMRTGSGDAMTSSEMDSSLTNNPVEATFYRVFCPEDRIQFPQWQDFIDQYLYFDVWTPIQGSYHLELWADGQRLYTADNDVPPDGYFGVYDGWYDPADWPYAGYYEYNLWELRVTVTPSPGFGEGENAAPATTTVTKIQRRPRWNYRTGMVAQLDPTRIFAPNVWAAVQQEYDAAMEVTYGACYNGAPQYDLNGAWKDIWSTQLETLFTTNDWTRLKALIFGTNSTSFFLSDLHYIGHGDAQGIGDVARLLHLH